MLDFHNTQDQFNVIEILNSFKKKGGGDNYLSIFAKCYKVKVINKENYR